MGVIHLKGIRCYAYHGCLPEETVIGGEYVVDVWIRSDLAKAARTDKLSDTIDYSLINSIVVREMKTPSKLVEHVCQRILSAMKKELAGAEKVKVRVTKINPPIDGDVREVSVLLIG